PPVPCHEPVSVSCDSLARLPRLARDRGDLDRLAAELGVEAGELFVAPAVEAFAGVVLDRLGVAREGRAEDLLARELPGVGDLLELLARDVRTRGDDPVVALLQFVERPLLEALAVDPLLRGDLAHRVLAVDHALHLLLEILDALLTSDAFHAAASRATRRNESNSGARRNHAGQGPPDAEGGTPASRRNHPLLRKGAREVGRAARKVSARERDPLLDEFA